MRCYFVDAFADKVFEGNPAGVCVLDEWPPDALMQNIAMENNLSETAFAVREGGNYRLRWFTPAGEIDLCGHATLAAAHVILRFTEPDAERVGFETLSGRLDVARQGDLYTMDFPSFTLKKVAVSGLMEAVLGVRPMEAWLARDLVCVLESADAVRRVSPDLRKALELEGSLLHVTARDSEFDCVSRSFAPKFGVGEDPVCGSGHCHLAPLWAQKLGRNTLTARQASKRGGTLYCEVDGERTKLSGRAALYAVAELCL